MWGLTAQNEPIDGNIEDFTFNCMGWNASTQVVKNQETREIEKEQTEREGEREINRHIERQTEREG